MPSSPRQDESPWIERVGLPAVLAFALGVILTDIIRDAEHTVAAAGDPQSACTEQGRAR